MIPKPMAVARYAAVLLATAVLSLLGTALAAQERPFDTSVCGLLLHPEKYNEGLVSVEGLVTVGSDEFLLHDAGCGDANGRVWLQFGGGVPSPGAGSVSRGMSGKPRTVEGLELPLTKDRDFDAMQKLLKEVQKSGHTKMLRATLVGKYFSGKPTNTVNGGVLRSGYGRMGCCSLLVIQEVAKVEGGLEEPVDFSPLSGVSPRNLAKGCSILELQVPPLEDEDQLERKSLEEEYSYLHDPKHVAARAVAVAQQIDPAEAEKQLQTESTGQTVAAYTWTSADGARSYHVVVNKPYGLLATAVSGEAVIWAPKQFTRTDCPPAARKGF
jgi:hypothetical protein